MSVRVLLTTIAIVAMPSLGFAQSASDQVLSGAGWTSCGKYIEKSANEQISLWYLHWAQGFLSGMNMAIILANLAANPANLGQAAKDRNVVILPDAASIKAYLDRYCRENPLDQVGEGALRLFDELQARKR